MVSRNDTQTPLRAQRPASWNSIFCIAAIVGVGLLISLASWFWGGPEAARAAVAGALTPLPGLLLAMRIYRIAGKGAVAIVAATLLRPGITISLSGIFAFQFSTLRTLPFFLSVTVVYLVGLFVETILICKDSDAHQATRLD